METTVTLLQRTFVTHDVVRLVLSRPDAFTFEPGQGVELAPADPDTDVRGGPFTPTSLPGDGVLEFTIKVYDEHHSLTRWLRQQEPGASLLLQGPFGAIRWRGPGVFIAGGAGITPFLAILRMLAHNGGLAGNQLLFSNHTGEDIIAERELRHFLGRRCVFTCTRDQSTPYRYGRIDEPFLEAEVDDFDKYFYVCGPPGFMRDVVASLEQLGVGRDQLVIEKS